MRRPRLSRLRRPRIDRAVLRDPRLLLLLVPLVALLLLPAFGRAARTESELAAAAATSTSTTTSTPGAVDAAAPVEVAGTEITAPGGVDDGFGRGGASGAAGSGSPGGGARRSSGGSSAVAGIRETNTTTVPGQVPTTTVAVAPTPVVSETTSPALMGVVGVGVAALAVNGIVQVRRRRRDGSADPTGGAA